MSWLKENKHKVLPEITDYTKDYPEFKWMNPKKMSWNQYFWMSGYNYMIIYYGLRVMPMITFAGLGSYFHFKGFFWGMVVCTILTIIYFIQTIRAILGHNLRKGCTLYNMMIMEKDEFILIDPNKQEKYGNIQH